MTKSYCRECQEVQAVKVENGTWICRECGFAIECVECGLSMHKDHDCAAEIAALR